MSRRILWECIILALSILYDFVSGAAIVLKLKKQIKMSLKQKN